MSNAGETGNNDTNKVTYFTPAMGGFKAGFSTTDSGVEVKLWRDRLIFVHEQAGRIEGPAICNEDGYLLSFFAMDELFQQVQLRQTRTSKRMLRAVHSEDATYRLHALIFVKSKAI